MTTSDKGVSGVGGVGGGGGECPPCKLLLCSGGEVAGGAAYIVQAAQAYSQVVLQRSIMKQPVSKEVKEIHADKLERMGELLKDIREELKEMAKEVGGL